MQTQLRGSLDTCPEGYGQGMKHTPLGTWKAAGFYTLPQSPGRSVGSDEPPPGVVTW